MQVSGKGNKEVKGEAEHGQRFSERIRCFAPKQRFLAQRMEAL